MFVCLVFSFQLTQTQVSDFSSQIGSFREVFVTEGPGSVESDLDKGKLKNIIHFFYLTFCFF